MILYEYPLNEGARMLLRLERLLARLNELIDRPTPIDHHHALMTLFEILEVVGRSDVKGDLMRDLERQRQQLETLRGNPEVDAQALGALIQRFEQAFAGLNQQPGKLGASLSAHDWLMSLRSRSVIPGGMFEFDTPSYHAWQHRELAQRQSDLWGWTEGLRPLQAAVELLMSLVRESGRPVRAAATDGVFQHNLPQGRTFQMLRLRLDAAQGVVPEITGHRLMVAIRFVRPDADGRMRTAAEDVFFEWALCA